MKRLVLLLILGVAFTMLFAQVESNPADNNAVERTEEADDGGFQIGFGFMTYQKIFWGVVNSSVSESEAGGVKFQPANGFQIGVSGTEYFLKIKGKTVIENEQGFKYIRRDYKINYDDVVTRSYLDAFYNLRYDALSKGIVYPYIGFGVSWLLSGPHQSKTWVSDVPLNVGIEVHGFRYEYSHGTYPSTILNDHKAKTNTHSFSWGVKF